VKERDGKCAEKFGADKNSILIFRTFDISPLQYGGASNPTDLRQAIREISRPALVEFDEEIVPLIFDEQKDAIILFTDSIDEDFVRIFEDAAYKLRGEAIFVISGT
jgi:hypothetical protein